LEQAILVHDEAIARRPRRVAAVVPARKTVTIVSAGLGEPEWADDALTADPEAMQARSDRLVSALSEVAERHGATARRIPGGGVIAVFGVPELHEDDALRALRAAVEMRDALAAMPERSALRVGVDSGEVFAHETVAADLPATGAPVNGARRLEQLAPAGAIVFGPATLRLVRGAVEAAPLKSRSRRTQQPPAVRLLALVAGAPAIPRRPDAPPAARA